MEIAASVKKLLHSYGIHSTTIQPEFVKSIKDSAENPNGSDNVDIVSLENAHISEENTMHECLLRCEDESCVEQGCCPPNTESAKVTEPEGVFLVVDQEETKPPLWKRKISKLFQKS